MKALLVLSALAALSVSWPASAQVCVGYGCERGYGYQRGYVAPGVGVHPWGYDVYGPGGYYGPGNSAIPSAGPVLRQAA